MPIGVALDPDQGLAADDELRLMRLAAELGYASAWTNSGPDEAAFDRCLRWYQASGLATGISAVPANGQPADFYAGQARRLWESTGGKFTLVVGSGTWSGAAARMRQYLPQVRDQLAMGQPLFAAALGPLMLQVAGELADGVSLNWCTPEQIAWSRDQISAAAVAAHRPPPLVIQYIRTAVDPDASLAERTVANSAARYLRFPAYRRHFERMGVADELEEASSGSGQMPVANRIGAAGRPGETRAIFERQAAGLDLPIVRVLITSRGDFESARRVLQECRPT